MWRFLHRIRSILINGSRPPQNTLDLGNECSARQLLRTAGEINKFGTTSIALYGSSADPKGPDSLNDEAHLIAATPGSTAAARQDPARKAWRQARLSMEAGKEKHTPSAVKTRRHWIAFKQLLSLFSWGLRLCGLYERGLRNALRCELKRMELAFANLPAEFDGFRILQLSDLHVDFLPEPLETALDLIAGEEVDLCVLTGDYRKRVSGPFEQILPAFEKLLARLRTRHGVYAILGNHDCADMVEAFEALGIDVLINETRSNRRSGGTRPDWLGKKALMVRLHTCLTRPSRDYR